MNVDDIKEDVIPTPTTEKDRLSLIFERQTMLMGQYHHIEKASGLMQSEAVPVPIHDKYGQARLKDFAWRVTEEITEATAALTDDGLKTHFIEELSDALHFLIELLILSGFSADLLTDDIEKLYSMSKYAGNNKLTDDRLEYHMGLSVSISKTSRALVSEMAYLVVENLGRAMNCLKQKPWKQTHMITDIPYYQKNIVNAYMSFLTLCRHGAGLTADELYRIYYLKSEVNKFRQRSAY